MNPVELWHAHLEADSRSPEVFLREVEASGAVYGDRPLCVHRRPHFIDEALVKRFTRQLSLFHKAIKTVRQAVIDDGLDGRPDSMATRMGLSEDALALARIEPGYASAAVIARVDCFVVDGQPRFLELNGESPAGIAYSDALVQVFERDPIMATMPPMAAISASSALVRALRDVFTSWGGRGHPSVAIVDFGDVPTSSEFELFRQHFRATGARCEVVDPRDLDFDGTTLSAHGVPFDLVYRRLLVADMLAHPEACRALLDAYRAGSICLVNSLRSVVLHGKGLFAMLHDPDMQERFSGAERRMVQECVPWTQLVPQVDDPLIERIRRDQQSLVIKPATGHGGRDVVLGWRVDAAEWERAIAREELQVVQDRVPEQRVGFPDARDGYRIHERSVDLAPFLIHGRLAGFLCRLADGEVANVSSGASQVPVFITR